MPRQPQPENPRVSELDMARMSIVSAAQSPSGETAWESSFHISGIHYQVAGYAYRGRPFGVDGDLLSAVQDLFFQAGCPDDNRISVLPSQLLSKTTLSRSGRDYIRMREGLLRLASVRWEMSARWTDEDGAQQQRTNVSGAISDLWLDDEIGVEDTVGLKISNDKNIVIVLTATFADLIRQGLFQMLDGDLLDRLGTPSARNLYRSLAAHRIKGKGETLLPAFEVKFVEWTKNLGLSDDNQRSSRILALAHERLIAEGYLAHADDVGRGKNRTITYHFRAAEKSDQVQALMGKGVTPAVAAALSADHPERIYPALRAIEEKLASGWKPRSLPASIVTAIREPENWGYLSQEVLPPAPRKPRKKVVPEAPQEPIDPKDTVRNMIRLGLRRAPSAAAIRAVEDATPEQLNALNQALITHPVNWTLVESILGCTP